MRLSLLKEFPEQDATLFFSISARAATCAVGRRDFVSAVAVVHGGVQSRRRVEKEGRHGEVAHFFADAAYDDCRARTPR
jgi:hypothetical protein